jgi:hypothetical protein
MFKFAVLAFIGGLFAQFIKPNMAWTFPTPLYFILFGPALFLAAITNTGYIGLIALCIVFDPLIYALWYHWHYWWICLIWIVVAPLITFLWMRNQQKDAQ